MSQPHTSVLDEIETVTLCPYCGSVAKGMGCCGESSNHFEEHYAIFKGRHDFILVDPATGEETDDMDISRVE